MGRNGKGKILILHGWQVLVENYFPLKEIFTHAGFQVFVPQLPGFSKSGGVPHGHGLPSRCHAEFISASIKIPKTSLSWRQARVRNDAKRSTLHSYSLNDYVNFVVDFIKKKKIENFFLIGHSFGGRVAIKLAALYPEKVKALVLTGVPVIRNQRLRRLFYLILAKIGKGFFAIPAFSLFRKEARGVLYQMVGEWDYYKAKGTMRATFKKIVAEDLSSFLPQIKVPTLLIWGESDKIVPVSVAQKMMAKIPGAKMAVIPNASHKLPYEHPEIFSQKCLEFFASLL